MSRGAGSLASGEGDRPRPEWTERGGRQPARPISVLRLTRLAFVGHEVLPAQGSGSETEEIGVWPGFHEAGRWPVWPSSLKPRWALGGTDHWRHVVSLMQSPRGAVGLHRARIAGFFPRSRSVCVSCIDCENPNGLSRGLGRGGWDSRLLGRNGDGGGAHAHGEGVALDFRGGVNSVKLRFKTRVVCDSEARGLPCLCLPRAVKSSEPAWPGLACCRFPACSGFGRRRPSRQRRRSGRR